MSPPDDTLGIGGDDPAELAFLEDVMTLSPRQKLRFLQLLNGLLHEPAPADASTCLTAEIAPEDMPRRESHRWAYRLTKG